MPEHLRRPTTAMTAGLRLAARMLAQDQAGADDGGGGQPVGPAADDGDVHPSITADYAVEA